MSDASRLYLLDTNVLMHDPTALFRFEEHDIYLPMVVLEELDAAKKGMTEVARNVRQVSRFIGQMMQGGPELDDGLPLAMPDGLNFRIGSGRLFFQTGGEDVDDAPSALRAKADNEILRAAMQLTSATRTGKSCWCPRTSTCGSRPPSTAFRPRTITTIARWTT